MTQGGASDVETIRSRASAVSMAQCVGALLDALPADLRSRAQIAFDDPERFNWHFVPRERAGVALRTMPEGARQAALALLSTALGEAGVGKAEGIMALEEPLGLIEGGRGRHRRDPSNYSVTVFGTPGRGRWGWRIEGHHLSLNFTAEAESVIGVTPAFWGSNPAEVPPGLPLAGHRVLGRETDLGYALIHGLDDADRARATIAERSLGNIVAFPGREDPFGDAREGLALEAMPEPMRRLALELLETYAGNLHGALAAAELERMREAGFGTVHFAWGGSLERGQAHYWRLHGPITLIEYDNTQNDANHVHSVWHDRVRNFGRDPLREHYAQPPPAHGHQHG